MSKKQINNTQKNNENLIENFIKNDEIESMIKTAFEEGEEQTLLQNLESYEKKKGRNIETLCSYNFNNFVHSVGELFEIKTQSVNLKSLISTINNELQESGTQVVEQGRNLLGLRVQLKNIYSAIDVLDQFQSVMKLCEKTNNYVKEQEYHLALKTLDLLEKYLTLFTNFNFSKEIKRRIPYIKLRIDTEIRERLNNWLTTYHEKSVEIAQEAFRQQANGNIIAVDQFESDGFDFRFIYNCLFVFKTLDKVNEIQKYYTDMRKKQSDLIHTTKINPFDFVSQYKKYLEQIAGFFLVEITVFNHTNNLIAKSHIDNLWEISLSKIKTVVSPPFEYLHNPEPHKLLELKNLTLSFCRTLELYSYDCTLLLDFLFEISQKFSDILSKSVNKKLSEIVGNFSDNRMKKSEVEKYKNEIINYLYFTEKSLKSKKYKKGFHFTIMVPKVCKEIDKFITNLFLFIDGLEGHVHLVSNSVDKILNHFITPQLKQIIQRAKVIERKVQIATDLTYLGMSCKYCENKISSKANYRKKITLTARNNFLQVCSIAEDSIENTIEDEIDWAFKFTEKINWLMDSVIAQPHSYVLKMINTLDKNFKSFEILPNDLKISIFSMTTTYIANKMSDLFRKLPRYNLYTIVNLDIDLKKIEKYVDKIAVNALLSSKFVQLRQFINLIKTGPQQILQPGIRTSEFYTLELDWLITNFKKFKGLNGVHKAIGELVASIPSEIEMNNIRQELPLRFNKN
ncbi:sec15 [Anaeramoeba flamelloides]|uniref:Sec15 n=1 Tax=Anaeramoeba flamelloides TaxID=1746091 RepID=A0AAV8A2F4_9EUKA|nr:sec15 [Anaeramoeba flamelloides]KAJ6245515.1 sec15 [Anaeramoeba flamelloides]